MTKRGKINEKTENLDRENIQASDQKTEAKKKITFAEVQLRDKTVHIVAIEDEATAKWAECSLNTFKKIPEKDIRKQYTSLPIFECGVSTKELLSQQPLHKV